MAAPLSYFFSPVPPDAYGLNLAHIGTISMAVLLPDLLLYHMEPPERPQNGHMYRPDMDRIGNWSLESPVSGRRITKYGMIPADTVF